MAGKKNAVTFSNADGYRFVDEAGNVTAVLESSGKLSLRDENASLEVFESWQDFVKSMGDTPINSMKEDDVLNQMGNMGLGRWEPINSEPRVRHKSTPVEENEVAKGTTDIKKKKDELAAAVAARKAKTAKPAKAAKKEPASKELSPCKCGCGESVARNFKQGHDARVHGWGKKIERGDMKFNEIPEIAQKFLKDHGIKAGSKKAS